MKSYKGLVNRYIKNERKSIVPIFISIILTVGLITSVVFITQNIMKNDFEEQKLIFGDYDVRLEKVNNERLNKVKSHENIKDYALGKNNEKLIKKFQGEKEGETKLEYIDVYAVEKKFLDEYIHFNIIEGRLPENENEIILDKRALMSLDEGAKVGSNIEINSRISSGWENNVNITDSYNPFWYGAMEEAYIELGPELYEDVELRDKKIQEVLDKDISVENDKKVTYKIVGIIETSDSNKLFREKVIRLLGTEEIGSGLEEFDVFTYLNNPSKVEELANDIGLKYIEPAPTMPSYYGYPAAEISYPGYDKEEYSSIMKNGVALTILGVIIVFCFMCVYNTFQASVAKRIKVYGILRAIGGSRNQISYLIYSESVWLYLVAAPIGLLFGYVLTKVESYFLINSLKLLERFTMDFNLEVILITLISALLIIFAAVTSVIRKDGKLTPIEAIMDARGLTRNKKSLGNNILGQSLAETGDGEEDAEAIKEILNYEKTTLKFKIMKTLFKFEGELAHKNITRDVKAHKLTKSTLFISMVILISFFLQVVNGNIEKNWINKSGNWDIELSLNNQNFDNSVIDEIKDIEGAEDIYRVSEGKVSLVVPDSSLSEELKIVLRQTYNKGVMYEGDKGITASIMTLDENSIELYDDIDKEALDEGGVILVNKSTNYWILVTEQSVDYIYTHSEQVLDTKIGENLLVSEDSTVLTKDGLAKYYSDNRKFDGLNIVGAVDDDLLSSTFKSTNYNELDYNVKLLTTEEGLNKIVGKPSNNKILIKAKNNENRVNLINELTKISGNNNYEMKDIVGEKLNIEKNIKEGLGLNIIFAVTIVIMVILNLINTTNASILSRRKELAGMRAIGMSNLQEKRMIIGEVFYISLSVSLTVVVVMGFMTFSNQSANVASGKVNIAVVLLAELMIIIFLMIVSNLTSLGPLAKAKKFSIVEDLKAE